MLKAGFARLDVTPPFGVSLAGYFEDRKADGILDPIELNAVAIGNGENTVLLIAADLISMDSDHSQRIRDLIAAECALNSDHIAINCLHQHTSIRVGKGLFGIQSGSYLDVLYRKFVDVAKLALADMREAKMNKAEKETARPLSFIRRYRMKDGTVMTNPSRRFPEKIDHPIGEADNTVRLIRFFRETGGDIALVNFATHPDVIGGTKFSADWPGFTRRFVEKDLDGVHCILTNGFQGDTNHLDPHVPKIDDRYAFSAAMGREIADTVLKIWEQTVPCDGEKIYGQVVTVYNKTRTDGEERYDEMKAFYAAFEAGTLGYKPGIAELGEARRIMAIRTAPVYHAVSATVLSVGEVCFVGLGGEPFTDYSHEIRRAVPDKFVLTGCNTNGSIGYLPGRLAYEEGGYEARGTALSANLQDQMVGTSLEMIQKS